MPKLTHEESVAKATYKWLILEKDRHWTSFDSFQQEWIEGQIEHFKKNGIFSCSSGLVRENIQKFVERANRKEQQRMQRMIEEGRTEDKADAELAAEIAAEIVLKMKQKGKGLKREDKTELDEK